MSRLHLTNGDATVERMRRGGMDGRIVPWRDVLHEGPIPAGLDLDAMSRVRARYIADCGWADPKNALAGFRARDAALKRFARYDEVVLWFEHDLYDQFQVLQLLDWFSGQSTAMTKIGMICIDGYPGVPEFQGLGVLSADQLVSLDGSQTAVTQSQFELGRRAWTAVSAPDPVAIEHVLDSDIHALPYLGSALERHLRQFPSRQTGLALTERHLLEAVAAGATVPDRIFAAAQDREESRFMGDWTFWQYMGRLCTGERPLLRCDGGSSFRAAWEFGTSWQDINRSEFNAQRLSLTAAGEQVLCGNLDWSRLQPPDRWLGGVHLSRKTASWRWDEHRQRLRQVDEVS